MLFYLYISQMNFNLQFFTFSSASEAVCNLFQEFEIDRSDANIIFSKLIFQLYNECKIF